MIEDNRKDVEHMTWHELQRAFEAEERIASTDDDDKPDTRPVVVAFSAAQIVETRRASLRSRAVRDARVIVYGNIMWVTSADELRWNEQDQRAEIRTVLNGIEEWTPLPPHAIAVFAQDENLNWLLPNKRLFMATDPLDRLQDLLDPPAALDQDQQLSMFDAPPVVRAGGGHWKV